MGTFLYFFKDSKILFTTLFNWLLCLGFENKIKFFSSFSPSIGWVRGYEPQNKEVDIENKIADYLETHTISEEGIKDLFTDTTEGFPKITSTQYRNPEKSSQFTFDYSNNNGEFTIGYGKNTFVTKWSKASNTSIHAYKDGTGIIAIARIKAPAGLQDALNYPCDFSSRCRTPQIGDIIIWKNEHGNYAGTRIISIKVEPTGIRKPREPL